MKPTQIMPAEATRLHSRKHLLGLLFFSACAALLPISRLVLADPWLETLVWRTLALFLVVCMVFGRASRPVYPYLWLSALVLIPLGGVISGQTTSEVESGLVAIQLALIVGLAPFVLRYYLRHSRYFLVTVVTAFLVVQTFSALIGLYQLTGGVFLETETVFGRAVGLTEHPNVLGIMSVIGLFGCAFLYSRASASAKLLLIVVILVNTVALIGTGSLSSMLAGFVGLLVVLMIKRRVLLSVIVVILGSAFFAVGGVLLGLDVMGFISPVTSRIAVVTGTADFHGGAASISTRMLTYEWAWQFISQNPVVGVGMDATYAGTYNGYTPVHNFILHAWYRGGIFFFIWQALAFLVYLHMLVTALIRKANALPVGLVWAMVGFAMTSAFFTQPAYWLPLLLGVSLITVSVETPRRAPKSVSRSRDYDRFPASPAITSTSEKATL